MPITLEEFRRLKRIVAKRSLQKVEWDIVLEECRARCSEGIALTTSEIFQIIQEKFEPIRRVRLLRKLHEWEKKKFVEARLFSRTYVWYFPREVKK